MGDTGGMGTVAVVVLVAVVGLPLPVLTVVGARHRGAPWVLAGVAGIVFPVTCLVWYVLDEHPYAARR